MFDQATLDALEANWRAAPKAQPKQNEKKKKNFWLDQISTVTGTVGGIGGGIIGALGGGGIGAIPGAAVGGAAGSGLGELLENKITGDSLGSNVAKEAALGGVFSAGPIKLARAGIGAVRGIGKEGAEQAAGTVAANAAAQAPKTSVQGRLQDVSNRMLASQYGTISKPVARATNPEETLGTLAKYGITKPGDVERVADAVTGSGGIINRTVTGAVGGAQAVPTNDLRRIADDVLQNNGLVDADAKSVRSIIEGQMRKLEGGPAGSLGAGANPTDALEVMKNLEKRAMDFLGKGGTYHLATSTDKAKANALMLVRDELEDRLYQTAGANANLGKVLTPQVRDELLGLQPGNANWQRFVDEQVMKAPGVGELRSTMAPFVRARQIIDEGDMNSMTFGGRGGNLANAVGGGGSILNGVASAGINLARGPLARTGAAVTRGASDLAGGVGGGAAAPGRVSPLGVAARMGTVGAASGLVNQAMDTPAGAMSEEEAASLEDTLMGGPRGGGMDQSPIDEPQEAIPLENLMMALAADSQETGGKNADTILSLYKTVNAATAPAKRKELSAGQQSQAVRAQNAMNDLSILEDAISKGSLSRTMLPGSGTAIGGNILGTTDIEAALFNIGDVILRNRTGAQAPESEVRKFVSGFLPRGGESRESQQAKLERAYRELSGMANPRAALESPLEEELMSRGAF